MDTYDLDAVYLEIVAGLRDNAKINAVPIAEGWDAEQAIDTYYADAELGNNADLIASHGELTTADRAVLVERVGRFLDSVREG